MKHIVTVHNLTQNKLDEPVEYDMGEERFGNTHVLVVDDALVLVVVESKLSATEQYAIQRQAQAAPRVVRG